MGTLDDHWCNLCRRDLNKKTDQYIEFELLNMLPDIQRILSKKKVKPKGLVCKKCIDANPALKKAFELMVKAGNPLFKPHVLCMNQGECGDYKPTNKTQSRCKHISVIRDIVYCRRSHVGKLKLPRDKGEVRREENLILQKRVNRLIKDPKVKELMNTGVFAEMLETVHTPPSSVIAEKEPNG